MALKDFMLSLLWYSHIIYKLHTWYNMECFLVANHVSQISGMQHVGNISKT